MNAVIEPATRFPWVIDARTRERLGALASGEPRSDGAEPGAASIDVLLTALEGVPLRVPMTQDGAVHLEDRLTRVPCAAPAPLAPQPLILDIGAGWGLSSRQLLARHAGATVVSVEPGAGTGAMCHENLDLWNESRRLAGDRPGHGESAVIRAAAWIENGRVRIGGPSDSRVRVFETGTAERPSTPLRETVTSMTISAIVRRVLDERRPQRGVIDYLHIDAIGIAGPVFEADLSWLERVDVLRVHVDAPGDPERVRRQIEAFGVVARACPVHAGSVVAWSRRVAGRSKMHGPRAETQLRAAMPPI